MQTSRTDWTYELRPLIAYLSTAVGECQITRRSHSIQVLGTHNNAAFEISIFDTRNLVYHSYRKFLFTDTHVGVTHLLAYLYFRLRLVSLPLHLQDNRLFYFGPRFFIHRGDHAFAVLHGLEA